MKSLRRVIVSNHRILSGAAIRLGKWTPVTTTTTGSRPFSSSKTDDILLRKDVPIKQDESSLEARESYYTVLTLNQPAKYNPLSLEMLSRLEGELRQADAAYPGCRSVVLDAAPCKAFSAGHDMKEIHRNIRDEASIRQIFETCARVMEAFQGIRPVTVASVDGIATAAGCQAVAAADLAVATRTSRFALSGIHSGLVCSTPIVPVSRSIRHRKRALEMLLTGEFVSADQACEYGLINKVVEDQEVLQEATHDLVHKIVRHSGYAIARGKELFYKQRTMDLHDAYTLATKQIVDDIVHSPDACEGIGAFVEKRKPKWTS